MRIAGAGRGKRSYAEDDGGGGSGVLIAIIVLTVVVAAAAGIGLFIALSRKKQPAETVAAAAGQAIATTASAGGGSNPTTAGGGGTTVTTGGGGWKIANATIYESYPRCCKGSPTYDPSAPKDECEDYSGCKYMGEMAGIDDKLSLAQVQSRNIAAFYDDQNQAGCGKECPWWDKNVKGRKIQIRDPDNGNTMTVEALDTCGNDDCSNCCTKNAKKGGGTIVDLEINTAKRFYNGKMRDEHNIEWRWA